jgi:hypothetical protein
MNDALSNAAAALKNLAVDDADNKNLIRETDGKSNREPVVVR